MTVHYIGIYLLKEVFKNIYAYSRVDSEKVLIEKDTF